MSSTPPLTYWDYIRVPDLIELQGGAERDESQLTQDEVVFITVHQVYELWFKLALRDLVSARDFFAREVVPDDHLSDACRLLERVRTILRQCASHLELVETISTRDYLLFRDKLFPANGGQSVQFREVEFLMGLEDDARIPYVDGGHFKDILGGAEGDGSWASKRMAARQADRPTLRDAVHSWLYRTPINGSFPHEEGDERKVSAFIEDFLAQRRAVLMELAERVVAMAPDATQAAALRARYEDEIAGAAAFLRADDVPEPQRARRRRVRAALLFIETYGELPLLAWPRQVLETVLSVEQAFLIYRQRHARMAERVIGRRVGTGGSSGVQYLDDAALHQRIFQDLWTVRMLQVRRDRLSDPIDDGLYQFQYAQR